MEIWKPVKGYEGIYEVSNLARLKTLSREKFCGHPKSKAQITKESIKAITIDRLGYPRVKLSKDAKTKTGYLHRVVAEAFIDPVEGKNEVNHKDGIKTNNLPENLEWCSRKENIQHAYRIGLASGARGQDNVTSKLKEIQVKEIKRLWKERAMSQKDMAAKYSVTIATINYIVNGKTWKDVV